MRRSFVFFILILQIISSFAQQTGNVLPATQRTVINNKWDDRAVISGKGVHPAGQYILWYRQPAKIWEEALPIGNGRLGAMVFGGVADERIQLNESSLWDGYPMDADNPRALQALPEVRRLLFENKNNEAVALASKTMLGTPSRIKPYQSLGELWIETPLTHAENYVRSLDLSTAIAGVSYTSDSTVYTSESFASVPDQVMVVHMTAGEKKKISFKLTLRRQQDAGCVPGANDKNSLVLKGRLPIKDSTGTPRGIRFAAKVKAIARDGSVTVDGATLTVTGATEVTLYIAGATSYPGLKNLAKGIETSNLDPEKTCSESIRHASARSYQQLKADHIAAHRKLFNRVSIQLPPAEKEDSLPTDELLQKAKETGSLSPRLIENYFQFGRYLLISSSRPGNLPANLQGLWAWQMNPPWNADFHTNINVQMNYWPAEITNLSELHEPLFDLEEALVKPGERTAAKMYGAKGWVVHHLTDAWGFTAPADGPQGIWPMGAAWLARHPWEHFCYTKDTAFLAQKGYPLMKGAAMFILDFLIKAPEGTACPGKLVTNPSYSPENTFVLPGGGTSVFTYGATMDLEIIHDLLTNCIDACNILKRDHAFKEQCRETLDQLAPIRISSATGRIMEWAEDYKETEPHHRHTSHLYALYPGNQITVDGTPELAEAAKKTLEARGDAGTGWSLAWKINMWNRLHDGDHAFRLLTVLLSTKTLPNLFDNHPPFQIDGNFGATAAIAEMFLQSQLKDKEGNYIVNLLPALPASLPSGKIKGLCASGGFQIGLEWNNGQLTSASILSKKGGVLHIQLGKVSKQIDTKMQQTIRLDGNLNLIP
ncbi:MAG TPA: glycoside hydrolase family 95 protein [Puia sp.]|nr:glycoside hydrolase family 95 protein [Puia sp.]